MWGRLPEQLTCILNEDEATPYATFPHLPPSPHFQKEPFVFFRCSLATPITTPSHQKINKTSIIHHIISESFWIYIYIYIYIRYVYIYLYTLNILFHNISVVNFLALLPEAFRFAFLMASHQDFLIWATIPTLQSWSLVWPGRGWWVISWLWLFHVIRYMWGL